MQPLQPPDNPAMAFPRDPGARVYTWTVQVPEQSVQGLEEALVNACQDSLSQLGMTAWPEEFIPQIEAAQQAVLTLVDSRAFGTGPFSIVLTGSWPSPDSDGSVSVSIGLSELSPEEAERRRQQAEDAAKRIEVLKDRLPTPEAIKARRARLESLGRPPAPPEKEDSET